MLQNPAPPKGCWWSLFQWDVATIHSHSEWIKRHGKSSIGQLCAELTWACFLVKLKKLPTNKVTRLLSTREKSIKIEHLTWYLQCFYTVFCVYHHSRSRTAKVRKTCFSSRAAWVSSLYGYVGRRTGISIHTNVAWRVCVCASARGTCSSVAWLVCRSILERYY